MHVTVQNASHSRADWPFMPVRGQPLSYWPAQNPRALFNKKESGEQDAKDCNTSIWGTKTAETPRQHKRLKLRGRVVAKCATNQRWAAPKSARRFSVFHSVMGGVESDRRVL